MSRETRDVEIGACLYLPGVIMVSLIFFHSLWGSAACTNLSSCKLETDLSVLCDSLEPAMTESPGMTFLSFSIRLTTSGW